MDDLVYVVKTPDTIVAVYTNLDTAEKWVEERKNANPELNVVPVPYNPPPF